MTDLSEAPSASPPQSAPGPADRPLARRALRPLGPVWRTAFRDPVVDSHLTLTGTSWAERQAARVGLVTLGLLLGSILFSDLWRRGTMLPTGDESTLVFLPERCLLYTSPSPRDS